MKHFRQRSAEWVDFLKFRVRFLVHAEGKKALGGVKVLNIRRL